MRDNNLTLDKINEMYAKIRPAPFVEIIITKWVMGIFKLDYRGDKFKKGEYILMDGSTWKEVKPQFEREEPKYLRMIGFMTGFPVLEDDDKAKDLLMEFLTKSPPYTKLENGMIDPIPNVNTFDNFRKPTNDPTK